MEVSDGSASHMVVENVKIDVAAFAALHETMRETESTQNAVINCAVQVFAFLMRETADGSEVMLRRPDGSLHQVTIT